MSDEEDMDPDDSFESGRFSLSLSLALPPSLPPSLPLPYLLLFTITH